MIKVNGHLQDELSHVAIDPLECDLVKAKMHLIAEALNRTHLIVVVVVVVVIVAVVDDDLRTIYS